jgi:hypothetical protein
MVNRELNKIIPSETITIEGISQKHDDTLIVSLTVHLINAKLPADQDSIINIQKQIANKLRNLLIDPNQFKSYNVWFMYQKGDWAKSEKGPLYSHSFNLNDL